MLLKDDNLEVTVNGYGEKRTSRVNITLEPTIKAKAAAKCTRLNIPLTECINQLLFLWAKNEEIEPLAVQESLFSNSEEESV